MSDTTEKAPKKGKSKLLLIVPLFVLLGGGGAGAWWYLKAAPAADGEAPVKVVEPTGMIELGSFTANLIDPGGRKYLRATIVLVVEEKEAKKVEESKLTFPRMRSSVLEVITGKASTELSTPEGRQALKQAVAETVHAIAHIAVHDVLFEEFIVQ